MTLLRVAPGISMPIQESTETYDDREAFSVAAQEFNQALGEVLQRFIQRTGYYVADIRLIPGLNDDDSIFYDLHARYERVETLSADLPTEDNNG